MQLPDQIFLQQPTVVYLGIVIFLLWLATFFNISSLWLFAIAFFFLIEVDRNQMKRLRRKICNDERRSASQARPLSDLESAGWINQALERIWPQFLQEFISKECLKPVIPWFVNKYKPWTVKKATLEHLDLGRQPPKFMGVRTVDCISGDDDLVMDFCLDFSAAEDMIAVLSAQMARRVGLGITTNIHISGLQIEGKVRVGIKLLKSWPFISRVRLCFQNAPYVQMNARPLSAHGVNVSEIPLIAGWIERMVADVFEQSLVEPNMLVLDAEKLVSCLCESFTLNATMLGKCLDIQERAAHIAIVKLRILEASDLKPSDMNGLADPYVRGSFSAYRFKTKVQKKTLKPRWFEEFEIPIASWELPTLLVLRVRDKDQFRDDDLGFCELDVAKFRGGQHHDLWIPLQNVKMGRLHIALIITENVSEVPQSSKPVESNIDKQEDQSLVPERFEVISLGKGEKDGYLSIVNPGQPVRTKSWQQRQGIKRRDDENYHKEVVESMHKETWASSSTESDEEEMANTKPRKQGFWGRRLNRPTSLSISKDEQASREDAHEYLGLGSKGTTVRMKVETAGETVNEDLNNEQTPEDAMHQQEANAVSPSTPSKRDHVKSRAKGLFKHAGKAAHNISSTLTRKGSSKKAENNNDKELCDPVTPVSERTIGNSSNSIPPIENRHSFDGVEEHIKPSNLQEGVDRAGMAQIEN